MLQIMFSLFDANLDGKCIFSKEHDLLHRQLGWISKKENMVAVLHFCSACYGLFVFGIKHVYSSTLQFVLCDYLVVFFATFSFAHATHQTRTLLELTRLWTLLSQQ
jgi:hypothetical protein